MTMESLGLALIEASIVRPVVLVLAALIVHWVFRVKHPKSQHAIWTAALVGMLLIPILSVWMPHWNIPILAVWGSPDSKEPPVAIVPSAGAPEFAPNVAELPTIRVERKQSSETSAAQLSIPISAVRKSFDVGTLVIGIYLAGLFSMIAYRLMGWLMLRRVLSRSGPQRLGLMRESGDVVIPVTAGLLRPVVLLPRGWQEWDSRLRRVVLAHEFEHIRRRDTLVSAFGRAVTTLLWFHPLAWWMVRKISELSEMVCDVAAVRAATDPASYAQVLLDFSASLRRSGKRATLPGLAIAGSSGLGRRVDRLLQAPSVPLRGLKRPAAVLGLIGIPVLCLAATLGVSGMPQQLSLVAAFPLPPSPPISASVSFSAPSVAAQEKNAAELQSDIGVVAGRLFLSDGSPAPNTLVVAMSSAVEKNAAKIWTTVRRVRTDSEGRYRMEMMKGDYTVTTYFSGLTFDTGITEADSSRLVTIVPGQTVDGLNFRMDASTGVRVRGRLVPAPGAASSSIVVGLGVPDDIPDPFSYRSYFAEIGLFPVQSDGAFEFPVVPLGVYAVRIFPAATANPRPILIPGQSARAGKTGIARLVPDEPGKRVEVSRIDVTGVEVPFGPLVAARVQLESGETLPTFITERLNFKIDDSNAYGKSVSSTGTAVFALPFGLHRISFQLPFGYYMKSFTYGASDLLQGPLNLTGPATSEIIGTITTTPPASAAKFVTVRGHVTGLPDRSSNLVVRGPLIAFLIAPGSGAYGYVPLKGDGTFEFRNVPSGNYQGYVTVSRGPESPNAIGKTIAVGNANVDGAELPIDPYVIHDKR